MSPSPIARRLAWVPAGAALLALSLTGCSSDSLKDADNAISRVRTCAELVKLSAGQADDIRRDADDPQQAAKDLRAAAAAVREKAAGVDDQALKAAIDDYVAQLRRVADDAQQGRAVDTTRLRKAATALANACS
jgi:hypothetical protein